MDPPSADKPDLSGAVLASATVLTFLGALFVCTRLYVRFFYTKAHGWDDYFIIGSLAASFASLSMSITMYTHGYGRSRFLLDPADVTAAMKYNNFAVLINGFSMGFLKVSIGLSLLRLQLGKGMTWIVWGTIVLSVLCNALVVVTTLFGCRPLAAVWDISLQPEASCLPLIVNVANSYVQTGGNIITDLFYTLGPLYYLSKVKVSFYNKWALRGVFLIGLLATMCAVAKCTELPKLQLTTDPTADGARISIWVYAELNAGLIAAAIPPLKAVFEQVLRNVFGVQSGLRTNTGYASQQPSSRRRSRFRNIDDDEIAMHSHAARVEGNASKSHLEDSESVEDDQIGVARDHGRRSSGGHGNGFEFGITKTVGYTVREADSDDNLRR